MSGNDDIARYNAIQIEQMARRVHDAQVATLGTSGAFRVEELFDEIDRLITVSRDYLDTDWFHGSGFLMHINRLGSPWPTYTFYVVAAKDIYIRPLEEEEGGQQQ